MHTAVAAIIIRQSAVLTHAGDHLASTFRNNPAGAALLHGLRREQERLRLQAQTLALRAGTTDRVTGWQLRLAACLVELGDRLEVIALTAGGRTLHAAAFAGTAAALSQTLHALQAMINQAAAGGQVLPAQLQQYRHACELLQQEPWRHPTPPGTDPASDVVLGCAFAVVLNILETTGMLLVDAPESVTGTGGIALPPALHGSEKRA